MKETAMILRYLLTVLAAMLCTANLLAAEKQPDTRCYELRTYYANEGRLDDLNTLFRDHVIKLFEKHGMTLVGFWMPLDNPDRKFYYMLSYPNREAREAAWKAFRADPEWKGANAAANKESKLLSKHDIIFLHATDYSPAIKPEAGTEPRVFELRTYTCTKGNLPRLHDRFRDHTMKLFTKHGMSHFGYWSLDDDQPAAADTLVYLLTHKSKDSCAASFKAFREDPDWIAAKDASEKAAGGSLTAPGGVKSVLLGPTDYSPAK
jgi:hypothetical protein